MRVENLTELSTAERGDRSLAQRRAFASTHTILGVRDGAFLSLMDPPDGARDAAAACDNQGTWPVLVGEPGETDSILSSPIILYDYPDIAPESPGDLFDATEIDEILTLRISDHDRCGKARNGFGRCARPGAARTHSWFDCGGTCSDARRHAAGRIAARGQDSLFGGSGGTPSRALPRC